MKKLLSIALTVCFLMAGCLSLEANTQKDYKVLKNSLHGVKGKTVTWLRISVTEGKNENVMIKVPIALIELFSDSLNKKVNINEKDINIKEILEVLISNGPQTLIEITDNKKHEVVKIWVE
jgi:copper chaperone CopZ